MLAILTYMDLACVIFTKKITMRFCLLIVSFLPFYFLVFSLLCIMRECEQESWIFFLSSAFLDSFLSSLSPLKQQNCFRLNPSSGFSSYILRLVSSLKGKNCIYNFLPYTSSTARRVVKLSEQVPVRFPDSVFPSCLKREVLVKDYWWKITLWICQGTVSVCGSNLELQGLFEELGQVCFEEACVFLACTLTILRDSTLN